MGSAQARKWSQPRNVLLVSHAAIFRKYTVIFRAHIYMGTVKQSLCTFLLQVVTPIQQTSHHTEVFGHPYSRKHL